MRSLPFSGITAALVLALGGPLAAAPMQVDPSGRGQVLIHPYYTVREGLATILVVHNGDQAAKALRLTVREAHNGRVALALNLYLRPYERWGATLIERPGGPVLRSTGDACIVAATTGADGDYPFTTADYTGGRRDHPIEAAAQLSDIDRTRSGLVEVIEMGTLAAGDGPAELADEVIGTRTAGGVYQRDCAAVASAWQGIWATDPAASIGLPRGGLSGSVQIVDVEGGALFAVAATAIDHFYTVAAAPGHLHQAPRVPFPDLSAADHGGMVEVAIAGLDQTVEVPNDPASPYPDAVSLLLMTEGIENRVNADAVLEGRADFVVSLPTRHYYTDLVLPPATPGTLFADPFADDGASCSPVQQLMAGADGYGYGLRRHDPDDIPCILPPPVTHPKVCGSVATLRVAGPGANRGPLADPAPAIAVTLPPTEPDATLGLRFDTARVIGPCNTPPPIPSPYLEIGGVRWTGLPAIGFVAQGYLNTNATPGRIATYDSALPHRRLPPLQR